MNEICREKTLLEEINDLEIEENVKKRLVYKCNKLIMDLSHERLCNYQSDTRIHELEQTIANMCAKQFNSKRAEELWDVTQYYPKEAQKGEEND